ncbi:zinc finger BED domain-containing protein 5-like, partial [Limulus polyphemus]|uniref:Zinc finger BED domain-containing protein 5-like n=1 Tax=Limulus polyphemus TaxID=6850 RepID=A0ABM1BX36_LIMPO
NKRALITSYRISYRIAKEGESHTIAENLIKPCVKDFVGCMIDEKYLQNINCVHLSKNTVSGRIEDMSAFCENELIRRVKLSPTFSLQMDESTDVTGLAILLVFIRYMHESRIVEDILLCKPLATHTTGEEIFKLVHFFMKEHRISWKQCSSICTDGVAAMIGKILGVVARMKKENPEIESIHCLLHRHALATKRSACP